MDKKYAPWKPTTDRLVLKTVLKLIEELGELISASARVLMQGIDECEPTTGKLNRQWLAEEMADVEANLNLTIDLFDIDHEDMNTRTMDKMSRLREWHKMA